MDNSFNNILFLTSFCFMAIDGDIAKEEIKQLQLFAEEDKLFGEINVEEEFSKCLNVLKQIGALLSNAGVQLGTPLLADTGAAASGRAGGQVSLLNEQGIVQASLCQLESDGGTDDTAADDNNIICFLHLSSPPSGSYASARVPMKIGFVGGRNVG